MSTQESVHGGTCEWLGLAWISLDFLGFLGLYAWICLVLTTCIIYCTLVLFEYSVDIISINTSKSSTAYEISNPLALRIPGCLNCNASGARLPYHTCIFRQHLLSVVISQLAYHDRTEQSTTVNKANKLTF